MNICDICGYTYDRYIGELSEHCNDLILRDRMEDTLYEICNNCYNRFTDIIEALQSTVHLARIPGIDSGND